MNSEPNNVSAPVVYGMDLSEYYLNVEWDILRVPAERRVKKYPCCPEPYPGKIFYVTYYYKNYLLCQRKTDRALKDFMYLKKQLAEQKLLLPRRVYYIKAAFYVTLPIDLIKLHTRLSMTFNNSHSLHLQFDVTFFLA